MAEDQRKYPRDLGSRAADSMRDVSVEQFLALMDDAGLDRALLMQAFGAYRYDNSHVADAAARYRHRSDGRCCRPQRF